MENLEEQLKILAKDPKKESDKIRVNNQIKAIEDLQKIFENYNPKKLSDNQKEIPEANENHIGTQIKNLLITTMNKGNEFDATTSKSGFAKRLDNRFKGLSTR